MRSFPSGPPANRLRQRKRQLLSRLKVPPDALPGSLALTHRRCGKPSCHCADGQGHPLWSLTFMVQGKKLLTHYTSCTVKLVPLNCAPVVGVKGRVPYHILLNGSQPSATKG
jgi:hypothetical protein